MFPCCMLVWITREELMAQGRGFRSAGRDPEQGHRILNRIASSSRQLKNLMDERAVHTPGTVLSIGMQRGRDGNA